MVASLSFLFVLASVATLVKTDAAKCNSDKWGNQTGIKYDLPTAQLTPDIRDWLVEIPFPSSCTKVHGVEAKVCDYDSAPDVEFDKPNLIFVHRTGYVEEAATVYVSVYCDVCLGTPRVSANM